MKKELIKQFLFRSNYFCVLFFKTYTMDTDIIAGIESELDTVLVLSGVTNLETLQDFPYRPKYILNGVGDLTKDETTINE